MKVLRCDECGKVAEEGIGINTYWFDTEHTQTDIPSGRTEALQACRDICDKCVIKVVGPALSELLKAKYASEVSNG